MDQLSARRWALGPAAILAKLTDRDPSLLGHSPADEEGRAWARDLLSSGWGVEDRDSLERMLRWLHDEGHSEEWRAFDRSLRQSAPGATSAAGIHLSAESAASGEPPVYSEVHARLDLILEFRESVGTRALLAWDLGRAAALAGWGFLAGYLTEDEAWDAMLGAAVRLQKLYSSWSDFGRHYLLGMRFWRPSSIAEDEVDEVDEVDEDGEDDEDGDEDDDEVGEDEEDEEDGDEDGDEDSEGDEDDDEESDEGEDLDELISELAADPAGPWSIPWETPLIDGAAGEATLIKRTRCHRCGAPKVTRSPTAYVYCDYCAALTDWDFQIAVSDPHSKLPGPAYEALLAGLQPELAAARAAGNRAGYRDLQRTLYAAWVEACPAACPPRVKDAAYREAYVAYEAELAAARDFDPEYAGYAARLDAEVKRLAWLPTDEPGRMRVEAASFWRLFETCEAQTAAVFALAGRAELPASHPDDPPQALLRRMGLSALVQGWLPFLEPEQAKALLARTGLAGEYIESPAISTSKRHCGGCGAPVEVVEGARRVLCAPCGRVLDVERGEIRCTGCHAPISVPFDASLFQCPYCSAELRVMRWAGMD